MKKRLQQGIVATALLFSVNAGWSESSALLAQQPVGLQVQTGKDLLQSGPMVANVDFRSAVIWVQTKFPTSVTIRYWDAADTATVYTSQTLMTKAKDANIAHVELDNIEPGKTYKYQVLLSGSQVDLSYPTEFKSLPLWLWRGDAPDFKAAIGSCMYINEEQYDRPGKGYGGDYRILESIHKQRPEMMVWLGDNYYLREPDWNTRSGIIKRATHTRSLPELQPLLASTYHIATWDDHDYGPNDSDRGFWKKDDAYDIFRLFFPSTNSGFYDKKAVTGRYEYSDVEFFLLDNRYYRTPNRRKSIPKEVFGQEQIEWLIDNLAFSKAKFKIVGTGGMTVSDLAAFENYATAPDEKAYLMKRLEEEKIEGVVFISGDVHYAALSKMERPGAYPLYDFTASPLTAGATSKVDDGNSFLVEGTLYKGRNFGLLEFSGDNNNRKLTMRLMDTDGKEIWKHEVFAKDLCYPKK